MITPVVLTCLFASIAVFSRGLISPLDRKMYSHLKLDIKTCVLFNNFISFLFITLVTIVFLPDNSGKFLRLLNLPLVFFALLLQLSAYAFSAAFKEIEVNKVFVASKISDLFIPLSIFLAAGTFDLRNTIFSCLNSSYLCTGLCELTLKNLSSNLGFLCCFFSSGTCHTFTFCFFKQKLSD